MPTSLACSGVPACVAEGQARVGTRTQSRHAEGDDGTALGFPCIQLSEVLRAQAAAAGIAGKGVSTGRGLLRSRACRCMIGPGLKRSKQNRVTRQVKENHPVMIFSQCLGFGRETRLVRPILPIRWSHYLIEVPILKESFHDEDFCHT